MTEGIVSSGRLGGYFTSSLPGATARNFVLRFTGGGLVGWVEAADDGSGLQGFISAVVDGDT